VLWWRYSGAGPGVELDVVRTAGALVAGAGGAIALVLAARRQRSTELTLEHQREVAAATERDAAEQRITELYTRAVDQLGAENAPVRLGGLHALCRLAQNNPAQRQTIVDVICAYLRMPYTPLDNQPPGDDAPEDAHRRYEQRRQELQVRLIAQRILAAHLKPDLAEVFWADIDLNLTDAYLHQLDLSSCHVRKAQFDGAKFVGKAQFSEATFTSDALFGGAKFAGDATFLGVKFAGDAMFVDAEFTGNTEFADAKFDRDAEFAGAKFVGNAEFREAKFAEYAWFPKAVFARSASFIDAMFLGRARFSEVTFAGDVRFLDVYVTHLADNIAFDGSRASSAHHVFLPTGWITRTAQPAEGEEEGWLYVVRGDNTPGSLI
jgi:pentapeptide repeat protein